MFSRKKESYRPNFLETNKITPRRSLWKPTPKNGNQPLVLIIEPLVSDVENINMLTNLPLKRHLHVIFCLVKKSIITIEVRFILSNIT